MRIIPTTAIRAPGIFLLIRSEPRMMTHTAIDTASVGMLVSGMFLMVVQNFSSVVPLPSLTPSTPCSWPIATWMPTPVRKPISTLRDRKLAMNPSFRSRAAMSTTATISAARPAIATYSVELVARPIPTRPAASTTAVAESAPTTRWREDPKMANRKSGTTIV